MSQDNDQLTAFLTKDYELKIRYLTDHFSRMWTRFNYFVGVESAIVGGKLIFGGGTLSTPVAVLGALVALVWYLMGAEDRFLVQVYRRHVAEAGALLTGSAALVAGSVWSSRLPPYRHVGEVEESSKTIEMSPVGWRIEAISTTRLAAWIPLFVLVGWIAVLVR
jgi:hypothetical protein